MPLQVCEYMNGGTLSQIIREQGKQSLAETVRVIVARCARRSPRRTRSASCIAISSRRTSCSARSARNKLPKLADFGIAKWSADDRREIASSAPRTPRSSPARSSRCTRRAGPRPSSSRVSRCQRGDRYLLARVVAVYMLSGKAIFADEDVYAGYKKRRHADELVREAL